MEPKEKMESLSEADAEKEVFAVMRAWAAPLVKGAELAPLIRHLLLPEDFPE
jgi:hypothetical protein